MGRRIYFLAVGGGGASLVCAQAPSPKALASTATIMIIFKSFNLSRLLSQQVAPVLFRQGTTGKQRFSELFWMCRSWANSRFNDDGRPVIDQLEQFNYVGVAHPNAAMTRWAADFVLVFCAMNVDEAVARIGIVLFQSLEPQDTRHHQVLGRRKRIVGLEWNAALKNSSARQTVADFLHYAKISSGCLVAPLLRPDAKSRSGHRVAADWALAFFQGEPLISNRDVYLS